MTQRFIVMGVSGCGKTSIGTALAARMGAEFIDGDDLHPPENIAKMAAGEPLDDADRAPWLVKVGQSFPQASLPLVVGCSALKRKYRDLIRANAGGPVTFLHLHGSRAVISERMQSRAGHFMPATLLASQFAALELPTPDEAAITVDIDQTPEDIVAALLKHVMKDTP